MCSNISSLFNIKQDETNALYIDKRGMSHLTSGLSTWSTSLPVHASHIRLFFPATQVIHAALKHHRQRVSKHTLNKSVKIVLDQTITVEGPCHVIFNRFTCIFYFAIRIDVKLLAVAPGDSTKACLLQRIH